MAKEFHGTRRVCVGKLGAAGFSGDLRKGRLGVAVGSGIEGVSQQPSIYEVGQGTEYSQHISYCVQRMNEKQ